MALTEKVGGSEYEFCGYDELGMEDTISKLVRSAAGIIERMACCCLAVSSSIRKKASLSSSGSRLAKAFIPINCTISWRRWSESSKSTSKASNLKAVSPMMRRSLSSSFYACKMLKKDGLCPLEIGNWLLTSSPSSSTIYTLNLKDSTKQWVLLIKSLNFSLYTPLNSPF